MVKAIIFDCFGVLISDTNGSKNTSLLELIPLLRQTYKTGVVSNIGKGGLHRYFSEVELQNLFDITVTSGDVCMVKPDLEIFLHASKQLGVEPNACVFIDDNEGHCDGARAAGMQAIAYQSFGQARAELEKILNNTEA